MAGCSTQKNTASSRWWHSFNTRYNTYYNGTLAYIDGSLEKENGNKDNFTEMIPLYTVANKGCKDLGKSNYETAITKCEKAIQQHSIKRRPAWDKNRRKTAKDMEWLNRKEYNPFLWKVWMLMGRSQFYKGDFESAASTFSYMSRLYATQPAIYGKARAWLAKCYIEDGWMYDAEDVIRNIQRDSIHWRAQKEWDYTYADYYIHSGEYGKAIPYLRKVIAHEMRRKQKAREWYLMGQLQAAMGNKEEAYKSFKRVLRQNPPYELAFNARIAMSEVMAKGNARQSLGKLRRMAASDKNREYLDQVYYAMGNIYLSQKDTLRAISSYEKGNARATRSGIEKGVLLLHLGDLYWDIEKYGDAKRCYGEAIGLLDKERKDYRQLSDRSKILDELVPYTDAIHLQDSLQVLANMEEKDRNAAIDKVIAAVKKKEKEQRDFEEEQVEGNTSQQTSAGRNNPDKKPSAPTNLSNNKTDNSLWYFYNPIAVSQGKSQFQRLWGKRENIDNWQRINKTVVASESSQETQEDTQETEKNKRDIATSEKNSQTMPPKEADPHQRAYYLAQIPMTSEQLDASNKLLEDGLLHAGILFKDKLDNLKLSEKYLRRLADQYPDCEHLDDAYYHLYLLYARQNKPEAAEKYLQRLKKDFPESQWTSILSDPYFKENALLGTHIEDSLYSASYEAFKKGNYEEVLGNAQISASRFAMGANRDKFLFIGGLSKLYGGNLQDCIADMKEILAQYPNSRISEMAGMIVNGINLGRTVHTSKFDLEDVWNRRSTTLTDEVSPEAKAFTDDRLADHVFMFVYSPDSINENQLLFEVAKYNFTTYLVRNFDIKIEPQEGLHRMIISGFHHFEEAWQYARAIQQEAAIRALTAQAHALIISENNLPLLGTSLSYKDYEDFYNKHYQGIKPDQKQAEESLKEPEEIVIEEKPSTKEENEEETQEGNEDEYIEFSGF